MSDAFVPLDGWGPDRKRSALCITFDNFGEAADIELGLWKGGPTNGHHPTVDWLPTLLEVLGDVRTTYFIEGLNATMYPKQIEHWQQSGHEVALHAWRHEAWDRCDAARRRELLTRSLDAMHAIGLRPVGFRPPGGAIPREAWQEFEDAGLAYCSPASGNDARSVGRVGGMVAVPFEWRHVDAYMIEEVAAPLRVHLGDQSAAYSMSEWVGELDRAVDSVTSDGGQRTMIFHPQFLSTSPEKFRVFTDFVERVRGHDAIWLASASDVSDFVSQSVAQEARTPVAAVA